MGAVESLFSIQEPATVDESPVGHSQQQASPPPANVMMDLKFAPSAPPAVPPQQYRFRQQQQAPRACCACYRTCCARMTQPRGKECSCCSERCLCIIGCCDPDNYARFPCCAVIFDRPCGPRCFLTQCVCCCPYGLCGLLPIPVCGCLFPFLW
jgi:hypothetical protein